MPATRSCMSLTHALLLTSTAPCPQRLSPHLTPNSLEAELSRLNRNKERRFAREKQKGAARASAGDSPADGGPGGKSAGTQRKCANCGQVGHIKTNKKCVYYNSGLLGFPSNPSEFAPSFFTSSPVAAPTGPAPKAMTQDQDLRHELEEESEEE